MTKKKIPTKVVKKIQERAEFLGKKFEKLKEKKETKLINEMWEIDSESKISPLQVVRELL